MQKYSKCFGKGQIFLSLFHVSGNFKRKIFENFFGMTKIDRHFLLPNVVICFTLYTREIARNHLSYFVACKCVIYFRVPYLHCGLLISECSSWFAFCLKHSIISYELLSLIRIFPQNKCNTNAAPFILRRVECLDKSLRIRTV